MNSSVLPCLTNDMDFWRINNEKYKVKIKWSRNYFKDYRDLASQFYKCGYSIFNEVIDNEENTFKSDVWFLMGIFLIRQSIELELKALLCRNYANNKCIQDSFQKCCHNLSKLFQCYCDIGKEDFLTDEEKKWLIEYLHSLEEVDSKSDVFRFPFEDAFLLEYNDKFLDIINVSGNLIQAFLLVNKCVRKGKIICEDKLDLGLTPIFFVFSSAQMEYNCYLWESASNEGFDKKIMGYITSIDFIYNSNNISNEIKFYPLMFMFRTTLELCLKRFFYSPDQTIIPNKILCSKRRSHLIKKDLWKNVKPLIMKYADNSVSDVEMTNIVENLVNDISMIDKNGDNFRYPTSYSLEYRFDNKNIDLKNIYEYFRALIDFFEGCDAKIYDIVNSKY